MLFCKRGEPKSNQQSSRAEISAETRAKIERTIREACAAGLKPRNIVDLLDRELKNWSQTLAVTERVI